MFKSAAIRLRPIFSPGRKWRVCRLQRKKTEDVVDKLRTLR